MSTVQNTLSEQVIVSADPGQNSNQIEPRDPNPQGLFADAILDESSAHQRRSPLDWAISLFVHTFLLAVFVIAPLFFDQGLALYKQNLTFLAAPMPPMAAPPPPPTASAPRANQSAPKTFTPGKLMAPSVVPRVIAPSSPGEVVQPDTIMAGIPGGTAGGFPGGQLGGVLGGVVNAAPPPIVNEGPKKPVVIGGNLKPPRLISGPAPDYPVLARQSRIFGIVVVEAIIDERGNVTGVRAVSGHPLLVPSALKAVSLRKYEPTILDGEATPIDLRVEVKFSMT